MGKQQRREQDRQRRGELERAVRAMIAASDNPHSELVVDQPVPGWLLAAMNRAKHKAKPGGTPSVVIAELFTHGGTELVRVYMVHDLTQVPDEDASS